MEPMSIKYLGTIDCSSRGFCENWSIRGILRVQLETFAAHPKIIPKDSLGTG